MLGLKMLIIGISVWDAVTDRRSRWPAGKAEAGGSGGGGGGDEDGAFHKLFRKLQLYR